MRSELEKILTLQGDWASSNTEGMRARGTLIRNSVPTWLNAKLTAVIKKMPDDLKDLSIEGRDGTGLKNEVPWVRIFSRARSPRATQGWYLVYLFDAFGKSVYLSINQGTTRWQGGEFRPRPPKELASRVTWARDVLAEDLGRDDLVNAMTLPTRTSKLASGYELGNVVALRYDSGSVPAEDVLAADFSFMCNLLTLLYEDADNALIVPGDPAPEVIDAVMVADESAGKSKKGGRYRLTGAERKAIERRAMDVADSYLKANGYATQDVGATESYDIDARRPGERIYVEVKGTVALGEQVILTRNEVSLHSEKYPSNMLIVVSNIALDNLGKVPVATGGTLTAHVPWMIEAARLTPLSYVYEVPKK